ncbi:CTU2 protein, partial [Furnarius figulus]|nr:CTU2 protein [Furnarius figulus]
EYFVHKFRAMRGGNRVIFPGEKVPGGGEHSGDPVGGPGGGSRASDRPCSALGGATCLPEGAVRRRGGEQREQTLAHMEGGLQATGFPYHVIGGEEALELPPSILQPGPEQSSRSSWGGPSYKEAVDSFMGGKRQEGDRDSATGGAGHSTQDMPVGRGGTPCLPDAAQTQGGLRIFEAVETSTAREELLLMLRTHLILRGGRSRGYSKVMTGGGCTRVAIKLLTNGGVGRGAFLAVDTGGGGCSPGFTDKGGGDMMVVRPMRDWGGKEIAFYNHFYKGGTVTVPPLFTKRREKPSIHHRGGRFLLGLQEDFPGGISTVYRTGEKLSPDPGGGSSESQRCLLCLGGLDIEGGVSMWAGGDSSIPYPLQGHRGGTAECPCPRPCPHRAESKAAYIPLLGGGCRLTFKELGPLAGGAPYVRAEAQRR